MALRKIIASLFLLLCFVCGSQKASAQARQNADYCKSGGRLVVFLLDITTPYDQTDKDAIVRATDELLSSLHGGEKLVIRTIADSHTRSERLLERCIPYCPANSEIGRFFNCSDGAIRTDLDSVRSDIISTLKQRLSNFKELKRSDIVRTIFSDVNEERNDNQDLLLYIYSDLIENSDYFSTRYLFSYSIPKLIQGLHYYKLIANLKGASVQVFGVGRSDAKDRHPLSVRDLNKLKEFWTAYFRECGATKISISQE